MKWLTTKGAALFLSLMLVLTLAVPVSVSVSASAAATMQLAKTQGTVSVANASGRKLTILNNMRLYTGYTVETKASSYAWISLDSSKLAKLDAASKAEVRKSGSKLEILLKSGNIFFNVSQPLASTETLNVRTSTAIVGIRGTCGWVNVTGAGTVEVYILEGTVECTVTNPATGETETVTVNSGEAAELTVHSELADNTCEASVKSFGTDDVQGFVLVDVLEDDALCAKILDYSGLDVRTVAQDARNRLAADEAETNQRLEEAERDQAGQESNVSTDPLWNASVPPAPTPSRPDPAPAPAPSVEPSESPSAEPSTEPSAEPSESISPDPSESISPDPSESISPDPSESISPDPSESISPDPSESISPDPSESISPDPSESSSSESRAAEQSSYSDPLTNQGPDAIHAEADMPGFPDVAADSWYAEAADYCLAHGLMEGSGGLFAPESPMTRAMLVTVLYRAAGSPPAQGEDMFPDVPEGTWYTDAVRWAENQGIVTGDENGLFRGGAAVSCQDAATFLWRFAGRPEAESDGGLADMEQVSLYARTAVAWARTAGILDGSLAPRDGITRAQAAGMIMRYQRLQTIVPDILSVTSAAYEPCGIAAMEDGSVLICDTYNKVIWRVDGGESTVYAGRKSALDIYGQPVGGYYDGSLDASLFRSPWAITPFLDGFAVTDPENGAIRYLHDGRVQTLNCTAKEDGIPKNGRTVRFTYPTGLAAGDDGCLYVSDTHEDAIRKITPDGEVTTFARGLSDPMGLCWKDGALYVADTGSNRILKIVDGEASVVAGSGEDGFLDGSAGEAAFSVPQGVAVDGGGVIYAADTGNSAVRRIQDGEVTTLYARDAADPDALYPISPVGLLSAEDRLYVCDIFARKVLILPLQ